MQPAELALRTIWAWCRNRFSTPPKWSAGPTRRFSWCTSNGWPTPAGHKGRRTGRQPATRGARRASRSLHSLLSQRPAHPTHRPGRARPRGPSRRRPAAVGVRNGCPDLPAGCLLAACHCSAACCWSSACQPCLLGACCSGLIPVRTLFSPAAFGGVWGCWRCRAWHWAGAETCFVVRFEWSTGFEFLTVSFNATRSVSLSAE